MKTELDTLYNVMSSKASTRSVENLWIAFKTKLESPVKQLIPFKKLKYKTPWISMTQRKEKLSNNEEIWQQIKRPSTETTKSIILEIYRKLSNTK